MRYNYYIYSAYLLVMYKFICDPANSKLTDFEQPFFGQLGTTTDPASNGNRTKKN